MQPGEKTQDLAHSNELVSISPCTPSPKYLHGAYSTPSSSGRIEGLSFSNVCPTSLAPRQPSKAVIHEQ